VRISAVLILVLSLAACNSARKNNDAVRQGVIDHLAQKGLNVQGMDVAITNLEMKGNQADVAVAITPKGGNPSMGMTMKYHLEQRDNKWTVVGTQDTNASPHGSGMIPAPGGSGMENPRGQTMPPGHPAMSQEPSGSGRMPSPESLPPVKKQ
jgi:hypothetical protein